MSADPYAEQRGGAVSEVGMAIRVDGDVLRGSAAVLPEMHVPGTDCLRTSILALWTDVLTGLFVTDVLAPRVPVTLDLSVDLPRPARGLNAVEGTSRILKAGRTVVVTEVEFTADGTADPVAVASATFMAAPDRSLMLPSLLDSLHVHHRGEKRLTAPFAERVGCARRGDGVAAIPRTPDIVNASNTINGGLISLVVEEAVLSGAPAGATLASLAMRYVRPARLGPAVGTAERLGSIARVVVRDEGADDRLVALATTRVF